MMEVDFNGLRRNLVGSFNELVEMLKDCDLYGEDLQVNHYDLEDKINSLRTDIAFIAGLILDDEPSLLDKEGFELKSFCACEDEEG